MSRWIVETVALLELAMLVGALAWVVYRQRGGSSQALHRIDLGSDGPRCVFLHGLGGTHRYWLQAFGSTIPAARITLIDLLGFGDSPRPWCRHTVDRHVERLHDCLGEERDLTLVGHSLGAALALAYAARYPHQVRRLVLLSLPHFGGEQEAYRWLRQTAEGWILTNVVLMTLACIVTRGVAARLLPYLRPDLPREVAEDIVKHSWVASTTSLWDVVYRHDLRKVADALDDHTSVICIHGARDMTVPADRVRQLADGRRNWRMVTRSTVDHHPWLREPGLCRAFIFGATTTVPQ